MLDQDEALEFYVGKLGLEVHTDADLGFMRWLTINVPGDPEHEILLEVPGPPAHDPETAAQVKELVAKGALGAAAIFRTDDCRKTYEELSAKGVTFLQEPAERPYGVEAVMRDVSGNWLVLVERREFTPADFA